jgi:putative PIN family toxin of toxin-antitoxin system
MRVVLGTNVVLSAVLFGGKPRQIVEYALAGTIRLFMSGPLIAELQGVLQRPKFGFAPQIVQSIVSELTSIAEWVVPQKHFRLVRDDPADNHVTDCAIAAEAEYLVTGDKHLLQLVKAARPGL